MRPNAAILVAVFAAFAPIAGQVTGNPENWCRAGFFTRDSVEYNIAVVIGRRNSRAYFYSDESDECPAAKGCATKKYVVPGNDLIVSRRLGRYTCAWYPTPKGYPTVGWIETAKLRLRPVDRMPRTRDWLGEWKYADNSITFTENKLAGYLNVVGDAIWKGVGDNVHVGTLDYRAEPEGDRITVGEPEPTQYDCVAHILLLGRYLVVSDNSFCGGANVTFSGVYRKTRNF